MPFVLLKKLFLSIRRWLVLHRRHFDNRCKWLNLHIERFENVYHYCTVDTGQPSTCRVSFKNAYRWSIGLKIRQYKAPSNLMTYWVISYFPRLKMLRLFLFFFNYPFALLLFAVRTGSTLWRLLWVGLRVLTAVGVALLCAGRKLYSHNLTPHRPSQTLALKKSALDTVRGPLPCR